MNQILTVFKFTFKDAVRKKAFIISTAIMLLVIIVICALPSVINFIKSDDQKENTNSTQQSDTSSAEATSTVEKTKTLYYVDEGNLIQDAIASLEAGFPEWNVERAEASKTSEYREQIKENDKISLIQITLQEESPFITVVNKDILSGISETKVIDVLSKTYISQCLLGQGIEAQVIAFAQSTLPGTVEIAGSMNFSGYIMGILLTMVTFFAVYYYGYGVAMSVATEKTSRVMETLIVSAKPSRILAGKCLGMGALGLFQFGVIFLFAGLCYKVLVPKDFLLGGMPISLDAFTLRSALLIVVFFILGYMLYSMMNAVCGASVSKIEDLNSAMMPVMMVALLSFYLAYFSMLMASASSPIQKVAMYLPFSSAFIMPFKLLNSDVSNMDVFISIALLVISIVVISLISARLYSSSVLHYGKKLKLKELYKKQ